MKIFRNIHYGYIIVLCCCLIMGVNIGLVMSSAGIFYHPVSEGLGTSVGMFGLYMSFNFMTSALALPFSGKMMDKYSSRLLLTLSSSLLGGCLIAMGFLTAVWQFWIVGGVIGLTLSFLLYLSVPTLINRWFNIRVGFFIGVCSAFSGLGGILLNPVGAHLISLYGWRVTYWIFGAVILLFVTPVLGVLLRNYPQDKGILAYGENQQQVSKAIESGTDYAKAVKMPVFYFMLLFAFLMISVSTLNLFIPGYIISLETYSLEQASLVASSVMAGVTIGKVGLGILNDRNSSLGVSATMLCGVIGLSLMLSGDSNLLIMVSGGFLFGWAYAGVTVQTPMLIRAVFGGKNYTQIYASVAIALAAGGTVMAGAWGFIIEHTSYKFILISGISLLVISGCIGLYALQHNYKKIN
ncbi:MFS transporter [Salmonella enterica]|nr:MFS transporter [Salmonella enterica]EDQ3689246.1 MFS transporter [Salmonella enterica subsp. enterica serovar Bonariensis]EHZ1490264.1 MFS transporter [Salmonella enterica]